MTATRILRRPVRTVAGTVANSARAGAVRASREAAEARVAANLQLLAKAMEDMAEVQKDADRLTAEIEQDMKQHKIGAWTEGMLQAVLKDQFSNEKTEVDPRTLFNNKHMPREHFFECVKVQLAPLKKFLSENEIKAIAKITPPAKTGTKVVITAVKTVAAAKPATTTTRRGRK